MEFVDNLITYASSILENSIIPVEKQRKHRRKQLLILSLCPCILYFYITKATINMVAGIDKQHMWVHK